MRNNLSERLIELRTAKGLGQKELAAELGISKRAWQDYELGNSVPGGKVIEALVKSGFDANWILTGEGKMRRDEDAPQVREEAATYKIDAQINDDFVLVPRYDIEVSAGGGAFVGEVEQTAQSMAFRREWLTRMGLSARQLALVTAKGDSMAPTIKEGDILLIDMRPEHAAIATIYDGIYVFRVDHQLLAKRLSRAPDGGIAVKSINPEYDSFYLTPDQVEDAHVKIVGRVVWRGGRM